MSGFLTWLAQHGGPLAVGYILPRVTQKLGETLWGRVLLFVAKRKLGARESSHQALIDKLSRDMELTDEQLSKLTPEERELLMHSREIPAGDR